MMHNNPVGDDGLLPGMLAPELLPVSDALDELQTRASELEGVSHGSLHALQSVADGLARDNHALQAMRAGGNVKRLSSDGYMPFDPRVAFRYLLAEDGGVMDADGDEGLDSLSDLAHDASETASTLGNLAERGLVSGSTKALADYAAQQLQADAEALAANEKRRRRSR